MGFVWLSTDLLGCKNRKKFYHEKLISSLSGKCVMYLATKNAIYAVLKTKTQRCSTPSVAAASSGSVRNNW